MFNQQTWRSEIAGRLAAFTRNPEQEMHVNGASSLFVYLSARTIEPFLAAFQQTPVAAVLTLAELHCGPGADLLVSRAPALRYQSAVLLARELRASAALRAALEQLLLGLQTVALARQRLNSSRDEWLRLGLLRELALFPSHELTALRHLLNESDWHGRYEAIRRLRQRQGSYSSADLVLLNDSLNDSASNVRAEAARMLGMFDGTPPAVLVKALTRVALDDCDQETRYAAARALGSLRERIASPQLLDQVAEQLAHEDYFYRSAAALVLGQLGDMAGIPSIVGRLTELLADEDFYVREAAARALGRIGASAATPEVLSALTLAVQDSDANVHEAAVEALVRLRGLRALPAQAPGTNRAPVAA
jgi:HEAT repeat protein